MQKTGHALTREIISKREKILRTPTWEPSEVASQAVWGIENPNQISGRARRAMSHDADVSKQ